MIREKKTKHMRSKSLTHIVHCLGEKTVEREKVYRTDVRSFNLERVHILQHVFTTRVWMCQENNFIEDEFISQPTFLSIC